MEYFVHESSYVDEGSTIGKGTKIWHFSHVMSGCTIGENCNIGQNVVISPGVVLGRNCKIQNNVSVYTGVRCEDDVFLGPSMVFTNVINPRAAVSRKDESNRPKARLFGGCECNDCVRSHAWRVLPDRRGECGDKRRAAVCSDGRQSRTAYRVGEPLWRETAVRCRRQSCLPRNR